MTFTVTAIDAPSLNRLRADGVPVRAAGGEPVRCCLRDAEPGEALVLANHEPPMPPSPYTERGAVFVHAAGSDCTRYDTDRFPEPWRGRRQVVRGYDERGWIAAARIAEPGAVDATIEEVLAGDGVRFVHTRNPEHGCYMLRADPDSPGPSSRA